MRQVPTCARVPKDLTFTSARSDSGDAVLQVDNTLHARLNLRRDLLEIQILDEQAPDDRRWLSILVDRVNGAVVSGTAPDGNGAWRKARELLR
jgi:hypothetical protein